MLTLIALSAALMQHPPAPPPPHAPPQVHTRVMVMGADGPGGLDKDGDGQITREEFAAPMNDHFARMDKDGDGRLSTDELTAGHAAMAGAHDEHEIMIRRGPGGPGHHGDHGMHMPPPHGEGGPGERIEIRRMGGPGGEHDLDADNDGRISEAEFSAPLREAFARMDADNSGFVEAGERGSGHAEVFVHRIETRSGDED